MKTFSLQPLTFSLCLLLAFSLEPSAFLHAASTTEVNISTLPHATSLATTNLVLVLTNASKARLATVQQIVDLAGGGDTIWTNAAGSIQPATGLTNQIKISGNGGINVGGGTYIANDGISLIGFRTTGDGDPDYGGIYIETRNHAGSGRINSDFDLELSHDLAVMELHTQDLGLNGNFSYAGWRTTTNECEFYMFAANNVRVDLWPSVAADSLAYLFDTSLYHTNGDLVEFKNYGTNKFSVDYTGLTTAAAGFASTDTTTAVTIAATGWTNTFGRNAVVYYDGTNVTAKVYNNAGTAIYTNTAALSGGSILLQPSGKVILSGTGVNGRAAPF